MTVTGPAFRIVGIGASMTAGTPGFFSPRERPPAGEGDERSQYAYWMRRARPEWEVLNRGMRGQRTDQILQRFEFDVLENRPEVMILMAGTNDLYQGLGLEKPLQNLKLMFEKAGHAGITSVAASIPPLNVAAQPLKKLILEFNQKLQAMTSEMGIVFCDIYRVMEDPSRPGFISRSPDDVHPDVEGYRKVGEAFVPAVEEALRRAGRLKAPAT